MIPGRLSATLARADRGYAMAALLVSLSVMGIMLGIALPVWRTAVQREREAELVFRGEQYAQAISLFSRRNGGFPTSLDALRAGRYIRRLYKDPITNGDFQPVYLGQVATTTPGMPTQPGQGMPPGGRGIQPPARGAQPPAAGGAIQTPGVGGRLGSATPGMPGMAGQAGAVGAGPIIGVVSKSTGEALRLYNGRGRYNEWLFVSTAATQQAGAPTGSQTPGPPGVGGGRGVQGGAQQPGGGRNTPPGRGLSPRGGQPPGPNPFGPSRGAPSPFGGRPFGGPGGRR